MSEGGGIAANIPASLVGRRPASPLAALELLKPITWFAPMWAFGCGVVSSGVAPTERLGLFALGVLLAGPLVCGTSQAVNDWFDRHVDAINEPDRPIPSGRIPGRWGLWIAIGMSLLSLAVASQLGTWGFWATVVGLVTPHVLSIIDLAKQADAGVNIDWHLRDTVAKTVNDLGQQFNARALLGA